MINMEYVAIKQLIKEALYEFFSENYDKLLFLMIPTVDEKEEKEILEILRKAKKRKFVSAEKWLGKF